MYTLKSKEIFAVVPETDYKFKIVLIAPIRIDFINEVLYDQYRNVYNFSQIYESRMEAFQAILNELHNTKDTILASIKEYDAIVNQEFQKLSGH